MGIRGSKTKTYSVPSLFSIRIVRTAYTNAPLTIKERMDRIIAVKTNFRVYVLGNNKYQLWINEDESLKPNTTPLHIIFKSECNFEDIGFLQFNLSDQQLFA